MHIVHISSVHSSQDPRIRHKQLRSILDRGWKATLITGDLQAGDSDGVRVLPVPPGNSRRWPRMTRTSPKAVLLALREDADIYQIHDPELLPWALLLRLKGKPVVYDIHEDYSFAIEHKPYIPRFLRPAISRMLSCCERAVAAPFTKLIAEKCYSRRFPRGLTLLNYPDTTLLGSCQAFSPGSKHILYTGNLTDSRGALHMARLIRERPDYTLVAMGLCPADLAETMHLQAGPSADALRIYGQERHVPYEEIAAAYGSGGWLAGLALFPDSAHYREKELTKFFEYMAAGLPVVASHFPYWRELIEEQGVGLCADPEDPASVARALDWLHAHPERARAMGERGQRLVREKYNWHQEGRRLLECYQAIAKQPV